MPGKIADAESMPNSSKPAADGIPSAKPRIWEIDFLRGLAIILMVFYHLGYDLKELCGIRTLFGIEINLSSFFLTTAQYFFAGLFIVLSGISSTLSHSNVRRALKLIGIAIIITVATYLYDPSLAIHFGILHCLGVCILIYGLTLQRSGPLTCAAAAAIVLGFSAAVSLMMNSVSVRFDWLLPFGITSRMYSSYDYFPLLPWLGIFLAGAVLGKTFYASKQSLIPKRLSESFVNAAGRHSLLIYLIHQPILLGLLYVLGLMR
jgi:uncharacterized membrane protein